MTHPQETIGPRPRPELVAPAELAGPSAAALPHVAGAPATPSPHRRRRTLMLLAKRPHPDLVDRIRTGEESRTEYLELARRLGAELLDYHDVERARHPVVRLLTRRIGARWGLAALGALRHRAFDDIYATGEDVGLPLGIMLRVLRAREKVTMVVHNADTPRRRQLLRAIGPDVFRHVICLATEQVRVLTGAVGFPARKVVRLDYWLDHAFFRPPAERVDGDYVLSVGMESRDYATLHESARGLPIRFHVIASGWSPSAGFTPADGVRQDENIVVERGVPTARLRALYAGARLVVVPLKHVPYAAGVTGILEAMAMGKAVVTTDSPGIRDYVHPDVSARVVPVGDAAAIRRAIEELWSDSDARDAMGRHNRAWIEGALNTDRYVDDVARLLGHPEADMPKPVPPSVPAHAAR